MVAFDWMAGASFAFLVAGPGALVGPGLGNAAEIAPHRAVYDMKLERSQSSSGIVAANGRMYFEWSDACDGWVIEQRYKLTMQFNEGGESELAVTFLTWESKDGKRYRFNVKKLRDGEVDEELRGSADASPNAPGEARFVKPDNDTYVLGKGALFPTAHTQKLIEAAAAGEQFLSRLVFDGGTQDGAFEVAAGIGAVRPADPKAKDALLRGRWWPMRLAFFPADGQSAQPDYELGMDVQDNGVSREMTLDYGSFVVRARLESIEPLPKPNC
jgi:hypothetical protein